MYLQKIQAKKLGKQNLFFVGISSATDEKSRIRIRKSVVHVPVPYQNVTDPQQWYLWYLSSNLPRAANERKKVERKVQKRRGLSSRSNHRPR
jgi:hypothetical protein